MPDIVLIAGPNGAGKSSVAPHLLSRIPFYLNADEFAKNLAANGEDNPNMVAGRTLLNLWNGLEAVEESFAVETTLATKTFAVRLRRMQAGGYRFHLVFVWIPSVEIAIERVSERVRHGGHNIPEEVIRRRYESGLSNFFRIYQPIANTWRILDNSHSEGLRVVARGSLHVKEEEIWNRIQQFR